MGEAQGEDAGHMWGSSVDSAPDQGLRPRRGGGGHTLLRSTWPRNCHDVLPSSLLSALPFSVFSNSLSPLTNLRKTEGKLRLKLEDREDRPQWGSMWLWEIEEVRSEKD